MVDKWFVWMDGDKRGPVTRDQLKQLVASGRLKPEDQIQQEGTEIWVAAGALPDLFTIAVPSDTPSLEPSDGGSLEQVRLPTELTIAGIALLIVSIPAVLLTLMSLLSSYHWREGNPLLLALSLGHNAFVIFAAIQMLRLKSHKTAFTGSILATGGWLWLTVQLLVMRIDVGRGLELCLLGLMGGIAVGIWSIVILLKPEIRSRFPVAGTPAADPRVMSHSFVAIQALAVSRQIPNVLIAIALLLCFPVGLFLVWKHPRFLPKHKWIWTGTWAGIFLVLLVIFPVTVIGVTLFTSFVAALFLICVAIAFWSAKEGMQPSALSAPPSEVAEWHFTQSGQQAGIVTWTRLRELAAGGKLLHADLVWKPGMANWVTAGSVNGLYLSSAQLSPAPPPPPPAVAIATNSPAVAPCPGPIAVVNVTYRGGHPDLLEVTTGTLTLGEYGLQFTSNGAAKSSMRVGYDQIGDILEPKTGTFPEEMVKKAQANRTLASAGGFLANMAGAVTGHGTLGRVGKAVAGGVKSMNALGPAPKNRLTVILFQNGAKHKVLFDVVGISTDDMENQAQSFWNSSAKVRRTFRHAATATQEDASASFQVKIVGCPKCKGRIRAKKAGVVQCPRCKAKLQVH
jgi:hypothetical protein